jgi:hypothetical protein
MSHHYNLVPFFKQTLRKAPDMSLEIKLPVLNEFIYTHLNSTHVREEKVTNHANPVPLWCHVLLSTLSDFYWSDSIMLWRGEV